MRNVLVLAMMAAVGGCSGTRGNDRGVDGAAAGSAHRSEVIAAQATWAADKAGCTTYHYDSVWSSFVGTYGATTIEIANDQPIRRSYVVSQRGLADAGTTPLEQWEETGAQVGSHQGGAAALTVEQLFAS